MKWSTKRKFIFFLTLVVNEGDLNKQNNVTLCIRNYIMNFCTMHTLKSHMQLNQDTDSCPATKQVPLKSEIYIKQWMRVWKTHFCSRRTRFSSVLLQRLLPLNALHTSHSLKLYKKISKYTNCSSTCTLTIKTFHVMAITIKP